MSHSHTSAGSDGLCGVLLCLSRINHGASAGELISSIQNYSKIQTTVFFFSLRWTDNLWNGCGERWSVCWQQQHGDNHGEDEVPLDLPVFSLGFQQFLLASVSHLLRKPAEEYSMRRDCVACCSLLPPGCAWRPPLAPPPLLLLPVHLYLLSALHLFYDLLIRLIHSDLH